MEITEIPVDGYERVVEASDPASGLNAIIAVHDTTLGPALGGLRMWPYETREEALTDALRLARGMTYKSAIAHTGLGGGKAVIIGDPSIKSEALYRAMGRLIESLGGLYITAEDVNTKIADLEHVRKETSYVTGLSKDIGSSGNPSPYTARGCYLGMKSCAERVFGKDSLQGLRIGILGVGAVGSGLARFLAEEGAVVHAHDLEEERVQALANVGVISVTEEELLEMDLDIFSPCALGGILNDDTIPQLGCRIVAGSANNQLLGPGNGGMLRERGILYAPDFVINAGGIINVSCELLPKGYDEQVSLRMIERIPRALHEVFDIAEHQGIPTARAADHLAERILAEGRS
ncbi:MAG: Glu/Leu/Phe/Val dehydrogenase dimerization domain-containing protein [Planctomycetota bacterium]